MVTQVTPISTEHLVRALKIFARDLQEEGSPFIKDKGYFQNLAGWLMCAAKRLEESHG